MDVRTPGEGAASGRRLRAGAVAIGLSGALVAPAVVWPLYARIGAGVILLAALAVSARTLGSALLSFRRREPPDLPAERLPTASVLITAYNEADVLEATVEACLSLEYPDDRLEVLVGYEAASTDGTGDLARELARHDTRVRAVERPGPPAGKAAATNHLLERASGEVLAVLDADQRPEPNALKRAVAWFADDDVWCVKGRCFGTNPDESLLALCATVERGLVERTEFYVRDLVDGFPLFTGGQAVFRAGALDRLDDFDESLLIEDVEMAYRIRRAGGVIRVDPGVVTRERNPSTLSAWWSQRKRWTRGGMQVARRYLGRPLLSGPPSARARIDFATTLGAVIAIPFLGLATPLLPVAASHGVGRFPLSVPALPLWAAVGLAPVVATSILFVVDRRDGRRHDPIEYVAPFLLWPYVGLLTLAMIVAFVEEAVLRREAVYVTSTTATEE